MTGAPIKSYMGLISGFQFIYGAPQNQTLIFGALRTVLWVWSLAFEVSVVGQTRIENTKV